MSVSALDVVKYVFAGLGVVEGVLATVGKGSVSQKIAAVIKDLLGLQSDVGTLMENPTVDTAVSVVPDVAKVVEKVVADVEKK
jgi:hypothetical protein